MGEIPEDIMKAARNLYMDLNNMRQPRSKDFEGAKSQFFNNGDKIDLIAAAIFAERVRWEAEVRNLRVFRSFSIANTDVRDCPVCQGPRFGLYVCTHCGDDE